MLPYWVEAVSPLTVFGAAYHTPTSTPPPCLCKFIIILLYQTFAPKLCIFFLEISKYKIIRKELHLTKILAKIVKQKERET